MQLDIVINSRDIDEVLATGEMTDDKKEKLRLVKKAKDFAESRINLTRTKNYTTYYEIKERHLSYVVSGCRKDCFEEFIWHFPIVGSLPYKGFFDYADALREKDELEQLDYDVVIKIVSAYSTLGYFSDPVFSALLNLSEHELVNVIIHELVHSTVYSSNDSTFNESVASFIGQEATIEFLRDHYGENSIQCAQAKKQLHDNMIFEDFIMDVYRSLDALYRTDLLKSEKLAMKSEIFRQSLDEFKRLKVLFKIDSFDYFENLQLNNAEVLANIRYMRYNFFSVIFGNLGRNWENFIDLCTQASKEPDPFDWLEKHGKKSNIQNP